MSQNPTASDWAADRGKKWTAHLAELEATIAPVDAPLIAALRLDAPCRIADIACGGGGTSFEVLRRAPAGSIVHGFDISPAQIEAARARIPAGETSVRFEVADVATATPAGPFDRIVSRFGVMFFSDPPAAFASLRHWLVPHGRFAFAVWASPSDNSWMTTVREVVAEVIEVPAMDLEGPGPFRYADAGRLIQLLEQAGFTGVEAKDWRGTLSPGGGMPAAEAAQFAVASFSAFADLLAQAGEDATLEVRQRLTARLLQHQTNGIVQMGARVHIVTGARPGE